MQIVLRQLTGNSLSDHDLDTLISKTLTQAGCPGGLTLKTFSQSLASADLSHMEVEVLNIL
jgi:hypothetical protein